MDKFQCIKDMYDGDILLCEKGNSYKIRDMQFLHGEDGDGYCEIFDCGPNKDWIIEKTWNEIESHFKLDY